MSWTEWVLAILITLTTIGILFIIRLANKAYANPNKNTVKYESSKDADKKQTKWLRWALIIIVIFLSFMFYTYWIEVASWFSETYADVRTDAQVTTTYAWIMDNPWWTILAVVVVIFLLSKFFGSKKDKRAGGSFDLSETIGMLTICTFIGGGILLLGGALFLIGMAISGTSTSDLQNLLRNTPPSVSAQANARCTTQQDVDEWLTRRRVNSEKTLTICRTSLPIQLYAMDRERLILNDRYNVAILTSTWQHSLWSYEVRPNIATFKKMPGIVQFDITVKSVPLQQ